MKLAHYAEVVSVRMFRSGTAEQNPMKYDNVGRLSYKLLGKFDVGSYLSTFSTWIHGAETDPPVGRFAPVEKR
jgi:hypothetical protein